MRIYKYPLETVDSQVVNLPKFSRILCLQIQDSSPFIWAMVYPDKETVPIRFRTYGTGHEADEPHLSYLGTYQLEDGKLVFHVFVETHPLYD
jgi:hypothetical protein